MAEGFGEKGARTPEDGQEERHLTGRTNMLMALVEEGRRRRMNSSALASVGQDIEKLKKRLREWSVEGALVGAMTPIFYAGSVGGLEGLETGVIHAAEGGAAAAAVATALFGIARLDAWLKERHGEQEQTGSHD